MAESKIKTLQVFKKVILINICLSTLFLLYNGNCFASKSISVKLKHLFAIDAQMSGTPIHWVDEIEIDNERDEIYLLDKTNNRIVITDINGVYLSQIRYKNAGINKPVTLNVDTATGNIYVAELGRIAVLNYRGKYLHDVDLSSIPDRKQINIQSIALDIKKRLIFIGENKLGRIIVVTMNGGFVRQYGKKDGTSGNIGSLKITDEDMAFVDSANFSVYMLSRAGGPRKLKFGRVSSLEGGFSMISDLEIDRMKKRLIVLDTNRMMVIVFDWKGNTLFEFGGPTMLLWPRAVAIDDHGNYYVADNTSKVNAFQVIDEEVKVKKVKKILKPVVAKAPVIPKRVAVPKTPEKIKRQSFKVIEKLTARIYFDTNSAVLRDDDPESLAEIKRVIAFIKKYPKAKVVIIGHTDNIGSEAYNQKLSEKRAETTKKYLVGKGIIEESRVQALGYGESEPIATNKTIEGRQKNRREDILIVSE